jgi:hypothetical protein
MQVISCGFSTLYSNNDWICYFHPHITGYYEPDIHNTAKQSDVMSDRVQLGLHGLRQK